MGKKFYDVVGKVVEMEELKTEGKDLFEELGLEVRAGNIEIGETYPIFGMITRLIDDTPGNVIVEVNHNVTVRMNIHDSEKIETLKERAFETGIFVAKVVEIEPEVVVECQTVIFGRPQSSRV